LVVIPLSWRESSPKESRGTTLLRVRDQRVRAASSVVDVSASKRGRLADTHYDLRRPSRDLICSVLCGSTMPLNHEKPDVQRSSLPRLRRLRRCCQYLITVRQLARHLRSRQGAPPGAPARLFGTHGTNVSHGDGEALQRPMASTEHGYHHATIRQREHVPAVQPTERDLVPVKPRLQLKCRSERP
jgi:hypothetical protein